MSTITEQETITITYKEYNDLLEAREWLHCLEAAGVDNWDGISYAYQMRETGECD